MTFQVSSLAIIKSFSYNEFIKDDLEFHLRQDFYCLLTVYSIILPKEHSHYILNISVMICINN